MNTAADVFANGVIVDCVGEDLLAEWEGEYYVVGVNKVICRGEDSGFRLVIPEHDESGQGYPGDIQPGTYGHNDVVALLREHSCNPAAIEFIADMLER